MTSSCDVTMKTMLMTDVSRIIPHADVIKHSSSFSCQLLQHSFGSCHLCAQSGHPLLQSRVRCCICKAGRQSVPGVIYSSYATLCGEAPLSACLESLTRCSASKACTRTAKTAWHLSVPASSCVVLLELWLSCVVSCTRFTWLVYASKSDLTAWTSSCSCVRAFCCSLTIRKVPLPWQLTCRCCY